MVPVVLNGSSILKPTSCRQLAARPVKGVDTMTANVETVDQYIQNLEPERQELIASLRQTVLENLDPGFEEIIDFGMIAYCVPLERYPETYNGHPLMYAAIASQKRHASLYLMGIYTDPDTARWFEEEYAKTGTKPNMGKSCVRFTRPEKVPHELIGKVIAQHTVASYLEFVEEASRR